MKSVRLGILLFGFYLFSCAQAPTKIKQEVGGPQSGELVLVDVRSHLEYNTYKVSGSVWLNSSEFLILKASAVNPQNKQRIFDPDLEQTIERLSRKGLAPNRKIILITDDSETQTFEAHKWNWLLKQLGFRDIEMYSLDVYIKNNKPLRPRAEPSTAIPWTVANKTFVLKEAEFCFANWSPSACVGD